MTDCHFAQPDKQTMNMNETKSIKRDFFFINISLCWLVVISSVVIIVPKKISDSPAPDRHSSSAPVSYTHLWNIMDVFWKSCRSDLVDFVDGTLSRGSEYRWCGDRCTWFYSWKNRSRNRRHRQFLHRNDWNNHGNHHFCCCTCGNLLHGTKADGKILNKSSKLPASIEKIIEKII